ncbi:DUF4118 domain-containing protein [Blautia schinkii]|nr:DUF4118 domain-containing protein [Blautia schinkii]
MEGKSLYPEEERPGPEVFLEKIRQDERKSAAGSRGRLKIFLGYAAGVGKTYAMLEAAHALKSKGMDVVAGYVEPHARPETEAMAEGLEVLPFLSVEYKGITLREFDLDKALLRKPALLLVDEFAHTNAEGMRHEKRYQDIEELLGAGIDVYTTLNIQHIESLNDLVGNITNIRVKETVPDSVFQGADQVELVDIEPDDLIERLDEGKVYKKFQAERALANFFTKEKLIALREIALRSTADRVNRLATEERNISGHTDYYTGEHILTCVSPSFTCAKVIRTAARLSYAFRAKFTALCVETPALKNADARTRQMLDENIRLAKTLGAEVVTVFGQDIAYLIAEYAKIENISKIVMGRTTHRVFLGRTKGTLSEQISRYAPNLDIYIIPDTNSFPYRRETHISGMYKSGIYKGGEHKKGAQYNNRPRAAYDSRTGVTGQNEERAKKFLANLLVMTVILAATTLIGQGFARLRFSEANIIMIYLLGCILTALCTEGRLYSAAASVLSVILFNFFFTNPYYTLQAYDKEYPVTFAIMFTVAFLTSTLMARVKSSARENAKVASRTGILLENSRKLRRVKNVDEVIKEVGEQAVKLLNLCIVIYWRDKNGEMVGPRYFVRPGVRKSTMNSYNNQQERSAAQWVINNGHRAGKTTHSLPMCSLFYAPLSTGDRTYAVVGIELGEDGKIPEFEYSLLSGIMNEAGLVLERFYG